MLAEWLTASVFNEVAALLVLAAATGFVGLMLRQPLIVSFIAVGILAGPSVLDIVHSNEPIDLLAELGVAILLFLVGIKLDVELIRTLGPVSLATGLGQVGFTSVIGFGICLALGMDAVTSLYIAVALTFSSTIIIVKLLSDKREIDSLHGRIALGFLIVQDLVVVLAMIVLSAVGIGAQGEAGTGDILFVLGAGLAMLAVVLLFVRYVADPLTETLARAPELMIGFAIALAAAFAAAGDALGFGKELGGLLAGVALASTPFRDAIAARLAPLRDFLLLFFFIALGARLDLGHLGESGFAAVVLSLFIIVGNPLIVVVIMVALGYRRRTGFLAGLTVAQISEFSLIFMAMGVSIGHVSEEALGLVTLIGLITIAASTYMITYSHQLFALCEPLLRGLERHARREADGVTPAGARSPDVIIFGLGRYGGALGRRLALKGYRVLGVDFSPMGVRRWRQDGFDAVYGDVSDPELIATLPLGGARWAVSTVRDHTGGVSEADGRLVLIQTLREHGFRGRIAVTSTHEGQGDALLRARPDLVLDPFQDAADRAVELIESNEPPERMEVIEPEEQKEMGE
ncbi:MAG TPA: cation:proton antiporter [Thermohalobaculum sp.]|nr:cation:proton antiporter [Thermohalobaculum sp.]